MGVAVRIARFPAGVAALAGALVSALLAGMLSLGVLAAAPAHAAAPTGLSAIAVGPDGTTYVGTADGTALLRFDAAGGAMAPLTLTRPGPVDGLAVDSAGNIWGSNGTGVFELSPAGAELRYFALGADGSPHATCDNTDISDPTRFGGIAVSPTNVFVARRCLDLAVQSYTLTGTPVASAALPDRVGGVAWAPAQPGITGAQVFVTVPSEGKIYRFLDTLSGSPVITNVPNGGSVTPFASRLAVDKWGQLSVLDSANDMVYLLDTNNHSDPSTYGWYRTLGRPGSAAGRFDRPTAIAQYPQDWPLSDRHGDLFLADAGNNRIQRWNTSGYTYWTAPTDGTPTAPTPPVNISLPSISGTPSVGATLTCNTGSWTGSPTSYTIGWNRNGTDIGGPIGATYVVKAADAGQQLSCWVRATNAAGTSSYATSSPPVTVATSTTPPPPPPPSNCNSGPVGVTIDGGTAYTNTAAATLRVRAVSGATQVLISNDGGFDGVSPVALSSTCTYPWTLESSGTDRVTKVVYVRFPGSDVTFTDSIVLDTTAPVVTTAAARRVSASTFRVRTSATDSVSGVAALEFARTRSGRGHTVRTAHRFRVHRLARYRFVRAIDRAGNASGWMRVRRVR